MGSIPVSVNLSSSIQLELIFLSTWKDIFKEEEYAQSCRAEAIRMRDEIMEKILEISK